MPKDIPKQINFQPGDHPDLRIDEGGRFLVPPVIVDVSELVEMLKRPTKAVTVTEMNQVICKRGGTRDGDQHECAWGIHRRPMPTVKNIDGPCRVFFYSFDCHEPKHVHIKEKSRRASFGWNRLP